MSNGYIKGNTYRVNQPNHEWDGLTASLEWRKGSDAWVMRGQELRRVKLAALSSQNIAAQCRTDTGDKLGWEDDEKLQPVKTGQVSWFRAAALWTMGYWRRGGV